MAVNQASSISDINGALAIHFFADAAGGTIYLPSSGLEKSDRVLSKTFIQVKGAVTVSYTLSQTVLFTSTDPDNQAAVLWDGPTTIPPLTIFVVEKTFTGLRLVFAAGAEAHVAAS